MLTIAAEGDFEGIARSIVDPAPEWLPIALAHFGQWIGGDNVGLFTPPKIPKIGAGQLKRL